MPVYSYKNAGVTATQLQNQVPFFDSVTTMVPAGILAVTLTDAAGKQDLDAAMTSLGFEFLEENPPADAFGAVQIVQIKAVKLASSLAITASGASWDDALELELSTKGGQPVTIVVSAIADVILLGGRCRLLVNGGPFTDHVVGPADFPVLNGGFAGFTTFLDPTEIPATQDRETYTFTLQAQRNALGTLELRQRATSLSLFEHGK